MHQLLPEIVDASEAFLRQHAVGPTIDEYKTSAPLSGHFSLHRGETAADLYGMVDAAYILHTVGKLAERTTRTSREMWAQEILACQDERGWFSKRNQRGHSREHATAYAIGALRLLSIEPDESYMEQMQPLHDFLPLLTDEAAFQQWIEHLTFRWRVKDIRSKNVGWHYIWRGSHIGGGVPAAIGMVGDLVDEWWPNQVDLTAWFDGYFDWLDSHVNPNSGYWQRALWNLVYRKPTLIDMGGAVHFFWIYAALDRQFPYPDKVIESTVSLQKSSGLYKQHPFCIDLDGNFCIIRAFLQLSEEKRTHYKDAVYTSVTRNFEAVVNGLTVRPLTEIYDDSHGLPGALAALVECAELPNFVHSDALSGWQHPLNDAWWL